MCHKTDFRSRATTWGIVQAMEPDPIAFQTDRTTLLRCLRAFVEILHERMAGCDGEPGSNLQLPLNLNTDLILESLLAYDRGMASGDADLSTTDEARLTEILATLRQLLEAR